MSSIISKDKDPLGSALLSYIDGSKQAVIRVNSDKAGDEELPVSHLFRSYQNMPDIEKIALSECTGCVLDIGAGAGSHSLFLQEKGLSAQAIDISPGAIETMSQRGIKDVQLENFYALRESSFDTLLLLMNGIGITGTIERLRTFLQRSKVFLNESGQILMDSCDVKYLYEESDGSMRMELDKYYGELTYQMSFESILGDPFAWLYIDYHSLQKIAAEEGFVSELLYTNRDYQYLARLTLKT